MSTCPVCQEPMAVALRSFNGVDVCSSRCCSALINEAIVRRDGSVYDADYFLRGKQTGKSLYEDYRWIPELTEPMCLAIAKHCDFKPRAKVLDFGCARGYIVKALRGLGYNAYGYDVSKWALDNSDPEVYHYLTTIKERALGQFSTYDWVIAKDVLEHVENIEQTIWEIMSCASSGVFVVVPIGHGQDGYVVPDYDKDITHVHRLSLATWASHFMRPGWSVEARYRLRGVKDNYAKWAEGNGFLTIRRIAE